MFKAHFCKVFAALSVVLVTQQVHAAAFNLNEHSASGLGRAFAGEGAIADNASVLSRNPAAMTRFKRMELSLAGTYIKPNIDLKGREGIPALGISQTQLDANDIAPSAFVPAGYFIQPINEQWAWGLGIFTNYGLSSEFDDNYAAGLIGGKTELTTLNFNPNLAYRINEQWSLGAGISAIYGDATLIRRAGAVSGAAHVRGRDAGVHGYAGVLGGDVHLRHVTGHRARVRCAGVGGGRAVTASRGEHRDQRESSPYPSPHLDLRGHGALLRAARSEDPTRPRWPDRGQSLESSRPPSPLPRALTPASGAGLRRLPTERSYCKASAVPVQARVLDPLSPAPEAAPFGTQVDERPESKVFRERSADRTPRTGVWRPPSPRANESRRPLRGLSDRSPLDLPEGI